MQIYDKETVIYCHNYSYLPYNQGDTVAQITENVALIPLRAKVTWHATWPPETLMSTSL